MLEFWDHIIGPHRKLAKCIVSGKVISATKDRVTISYWVCTDKEYEKDNYEPVNIIRSTILRYQELDLAELK